MARIKQTGKWMERSRKGSRYWSGVSGTAKGWCIFTRSDQYMLSETGAKGCITIRTKDGVRLVKRFGPFFSFEAAQAAHAIMHDME